MKVEVENCRGGEGVRVSVQAENEQERAHLAMVRKKLGWEMPRLVAFGSSGPRGSDQSPDCRSFRTLHVDLCPGRKP